MIDPTALLAELAAIQRDVRTVAADQNLALLDGKSERALDRIAAGLASLMSSIAAPPPVSVDDFDVTTADGWRVFTAECDKGVVRAISPDGSGKKGSIIDANVAIALGREVARARSIAAPPPVDNGMLAPIRARLDRMEREIAKLDERIEWGPIRPRSPSHEAGG